MTRVLVVDDDGAVRRLVGRVLGRRGFEVVAAEDGGAAVARAAEIAAAGEPLVLLLTDVVMPGMTGDALAAELRASHPGLRVVYMSGYSEEALEARGVRAVGGAYLMKPFTPEVLSMAVAGALGE